MVYKICENNIRKELENFFDLKVYVKKFDEDNNKISFVVEVTKGDADKIYKFCKEEHIDIQYTCNHKILIYNKTELDKLNKLCSKIKEIYECDSILFIPTDENGILIEIVPPIPF